MKSLDRVEGAGLKEGTAIEVTVGIKLLSIANLNALVIISFCIALPKR
jgi:hypothetical protein